MKLVTPDEVVDAVADHEVVEAEEVVAAEELVQMQHHALKVVVVVVAEAEEDLKEMQEAENKLHQK